MMPRRTRWPLLTGASPPAVRNPGLFRPGEPRTFAEFVGQQDVVRTLKTAVRSSQASGKRLPHILLADRRAGVGKTAMAKIIAAEMDVTLRATMGDLSAFEAVRLMQEMADRDVLFWDELHTAKSTDWLLPFMQSGIVVLPTGAVAVADVTLIAATTKPEELDAALLSRFVLRPIFQAYSISDMEQMLTTAINDSEMRHAVVTVSGGNPRELQRVEQIAADLITVGEATVANLLAQSGYGTSGLSLAVESYVLTLWRSPSFTASRSTLSALVGPEVEVAEAVALDRGLVSVTGRGRRLTREGIDVAATLADREAE